MPEKEHSGTFKKSILLPETQQQMEHLKLLMVPAISDIIQEASLAFLPFQYEEYFFSFLSPDLTSPTNPVHKGKLFLTEIAL